MSAVSDEQTNSTHPVLPTNGEGAVRLGQKHIRPSQSLEDYSRVMLQYTQCRMTGFVRTDSHKCSSTSRRSRSSDSSDSTSGVLALQNQTRSSASGSSRSSPSNGREKHHSTKGKQL
ncbi:uncharacterized protein ATNIH1004_009800 [Aspergillus tanneri]|uniref:Uncharacterized protein n=1 Tax=Aspergillus tanneri TaxID=1220188 RepID=A0A5M9M892_9EURO|nr:uncharacterized protein ATNIH1004_009800 [Aspergillus tanneri]KAA8643038.1 hypothetical protein ATNIH1004_009800 [Aspergillus tanneri]